MKRLSLLTQRKLQNYPGSISKYTFITFRREVFGIRLKTTERRKLICLQYATLYSTTQVGLLFEISQISLIWFQMR